MTKVHPTEDELALFYYGDAEAPEAIHAHLDACAACRDVWRGLRRTLDLVRGLPVPERDERYGAEVWYRIRPKLEHAPRRWWVPWAVWPGGLAAAATIAVLVIGAFFAGRHWPAPGTERETPENVAQRAAGPVRERILLLAVGDHLERAQMMLAEIVNAPLTATADFSDERESARDLVAENRLYRQTALRAGETGVANVLDDLGRVLVEIANGPSTMTSRELDEIRQRIDAQGLLFKVQVIEAQVRGRQRAAVRGGQQS